ncbi:MAG: hypothetical protein JWQ49_637 [Edaphobacter sp.]|nr:hypothetical protein [Edaphobacter sp.]
MKAYTKTLDKTDRAKLAFELLINSDSTISTLELASSLHNDSASLRRGFFVARYSARAARSSFFTRLIMSCTFLRSRCARCCRSVWSSGV